MSSTEKPLNALVVANMTTSLVRFRDEFPPSRESPIALEARDAASRQVLICDMARVASPDLATVEALCRLRLSVAEMGCALRLRAASSELAELIRLCGLAGVLPLVDQGQPEQRKEPVGVEEEVEPGDPAP